MASLLDIKKAKQVGESIKSAREGGNYFAFNQNINIFFIC
jgi:hypothetical protein